MAKGSTNSLATSLSDRFMDVWKLLSETTVFLSRTKEFNLYENQLRQWRAELQSKRKDTEVTQRIRTELVTLRKTLRNQGYDLSLGRESLRFEGFRNDACIREGFKRLVLFFAEDDLYWLSGEDNHIALADFLEARLDSLSAGGRPIRIRDRHYLWYRRRGNELVISGSDTETKEDFERLVARGEANMLFLLSKLKSLR